MKRPILPDFARKELRDNPESRYAKGIRKQIESWKVMRAAGMEVDNLMMEIEKALQPIVEWIAKQLKRFTK